MWSWFRYVHSVTVELAFYCMQLVRDRDVITSTSPQMDSMTSTSPQRYGMTSTSPQIYGHDLNISSDIWHDLNITSDVWHDLNITSDGWHDLSITSDAANVWYKYVALLTHLCVRNCHYLILSWVVYIFVKIKGLFCTAIIVCNF